jgi:hypothetical protein
MQGSAAVTIDNTVAVIQDQTIHGLTADSGRHRWVRPIFGTLTGMATFADQIVVATKSESVIVSGDGAVSHQLGRVLTLTPSQDHLVAWGPAEASLIARDGSMISHWELPPLTQSQQVRPALATEQGVLLFNNDWTFQARDNAV